LRIGIGKRDKKMNNQIEKAKIKIQDLGNQGEEEWMAKLINLKRQTEKDNEGDKMRYIESKDFLVFMILQIVFNIIVILMFIQLGI
jgi:hypothetical protein